MPAPQYAERHTPWTRGIELGTCQHWFQSALGFEEGCENAAMVTDLETGCSFCVEHWQEVDQ